jgi:hypothetical protein
MRCRNPIQLIKANYKFADRSHDYRITVISCRNSHIFINYSEITKNIHHLISGATYTFPGSILPAASVLYSISFSCCYEVSLYRIGTVTFLF